MVFLAVDTAGEKVNTLLPFNCTDRAAVLESRMIFSTQSASCRLITPVALMAKTLAVAALG